MPAKRLDKRREPASATDTTRTGEYDALDSMVAEWARNIRLPLEWASTPAPVPGQHTWLRSDGLRVLVSAGYWDGAAWWHISYSRVDRVPGYGDTLDVKRLFVGPDRYAAMVFPPARYHVNTHRFVLRLWSPVDPAGWPLPEFSAGLGTI